MRSEIEGDEKSLLGEHSIVVFFGGTFAWSWGYWGLLGLVFDQEAVSPFVTLPGLWGPLISALGLLWWTGPSVRKFLARRFRWQERPVGMRPRSSGLSDLDVSCL